MSDSICWLHWSGPMTPPSRAARRSAARILPRGYRLRRFEMADIDAYLRLATTILGEPVPHSYLLNLIPATIPRTLLVIEHGAGRLLVATGAARLLLDPSLDAGTTPVELINVGVDVTHRHRGLGRVLCSEIVAQLLIEGYKDIRVGLERGNSAAIALYRSVGFREMQ